MSRIKKVVACGYDAPLMVLHHDVFFRMTGCRNITAVPDADAVRGMDCDLAMLNCERQGALVGREFSCLLEGRRQIGVFAARGVPPLVLLSICRCESCSVLLFPDDREIEEFRASLQEGRRFISRAARGILNEKVLKVAGVLEGYGPLWFHVVFDLLMGMGIRGTATDTETTDGTVRSVLSRLRAEVGALRKISGMNLYEVISWMLGICGRP